MISRAEVPQKLAGMVFVGYYEGKGSARPLLIIEHIGPLHGQAGYRGCRHGAGLGIFRGKLVLALGIEHIGRHRLQVGSYNPVFAHAVFLVEVEFGFGIVAHIAG